MDKVSSSIVVLILANSGSQESIPAALTKDKKRIHGAEVAVSVAWKSTLYVTNFRDGMDDAQMRAMFEKASG
jgi:squamous cell carcinoma antigen recognized by T-cells 3